ncbi:MAG: hypothetical protein KGZ93_09115 [Actinobacteria bacterium]|nr:hypothetical protein [Actinomycetota bacterium]
MVRERRNDEKQNHIVPERRAFRMLLLLAIVSSLLMVVIIALESSGTSRVERPTTAADVAAPREAVEPPVAPVTLLPESILQYATRGRQAIPGSEFPAAEAIYEVLDANIALATPVNSYAKVTFYPSAREAEESISEAFKERFPKRNENLLIGSMAISTGYDKSEGSYFIGWTRENFAITIKTSFLDHIPVDKNGTLQKHAMPLAKAVIDEAKVE